MTKELIEQLAKERCRKDTWYTPGKGYSCTYTFTIEELEAFAKAYAQTQGKSDWIRVKERKPQYDRSVFCYCEIMGRFLGYIDELGTWHSWTEKGILPPTYWMEMPDAPINNTESKGI